LTVGLSGEIFVSCVEKNPAQAFVAYQLCDARYWYRNSVSRSSLGWWRCYVEM